MTKMTFEQLEEATRNSPVVWSRRYIKNEKQEPLDFRKHRYQIDILEDLHPEIVIKKSSQVGMTTIMTAKVLYMMDTWPITLIYTFPTATDVSKYSSARFTPMVRGSKYLSEKVNGLDNVSIKNIGSSFVYFGGTFTDKQAISVPADVIIHDELDFSKTDVRDAYSSRLSHSSWKYTWMFSTPTLPGYGIDAAYEKSDKRKWLVKCQHCNHWQETDYFTSIRKTKRIGGKRRRYWGCLSCGKELDRNVGEWIAENKRKKSVHGYFISATNCEWIQPIDLIKLERKSAVKRQFYNFHLGLAYAGGSSVLSRELLLGRTVSRPIPTTGSNYFMGVDQGDILHFEVSRYNDGKREVVYYGTCDNFERISQLIDLYNVRCCVIDALPNKHSARALRDKHMGIVYMAYYSEIKMKEKVLYKDDDERYVVNISRTDALDGSANQWVTGEAMIYYPDGSIITNNVFDEPRYENGWLQQMCHMKRDVEEDDKGQHKVIWHKTGADHFRHADLYNYIGFMMFAGQDRGSVLSGGRSDTLLNPNPSLLNIPDDDHRPVIYTAQDTDFLSARPANLFFDEVYGGR